MCAIYTTMVFAILQDTHCQHDDKNLNISQVFNLVSLKWVKSKQYQFLKVFPITQVPAPTFST